MTPKAYKWDAALYQNSSLFQYNLGQIAIDRLQLRDGERILDIGCGNAMLTIDIAKHIPHGHVVGLEVSNEMYAQAQKNVAKEGILNLSFKHMDAKDMQFEKEFDAVFSSSAIHWIPDQERVYALIYKALKIQGRIMIQVGMKEMNSLIRALTYMVQDEAFRPYLTNFQLPWHFLSMKESDKILRRAGFQNVFVEPYQAHMRFETKEDLRNYCKAAALVPFLILFPEEIKQDFEAKFLDILISLNGAHPLEMVMTRLFLRAEKLG